MICEIKRLDAIIQDNADSAATLIAEQKKFAKEQRQLAVKEFAEKLKKRSYCDNDFMDGKWHRYVFVDEIDELLKEYEK